MSERVEVHEGIYKVDRDGRKIREREDYDRRMLAAEERAAYEIGDPSWAHEIIAAFLFPQADGERLREEMDE